MITFVIRSCGRKISVLKMAELGDLWLRRGGWCNPAFNLLRRCLGIACFAVRFGGMKFSQRSSFATQDSSLSYDRLLVLFDRLLLSLLLFNRQIMFWGLLWRWGFSWCPGAVDRLLAPSKNRSMFDERFESSILRQWCIICLLWKLCCDRKWILNYRLVWHNGGLWRGHHHCRLFKDRRWHWIGLFISERKDTSLHSCQVFRETIDRLSLIWLLKDGRGWHLCRLIIQMCLAIYPSCTKSTIRNLCWKLDCGSCRIHQWLSWSFERKSSSYRSRATILDVGRCSLATVCCIVRRDDDSFQLLGQKMDLSACLFWCVTIGPETTLHSSSSNYRERPRSTHLNFHVHGRWLWRVFTINSSWS